MSERQTFTIEIQQSHFYDLVLSPTHRYNLYVAGGTKQALGSASLYVTSNLAVLGTLMQAILEGVANIVTTSQLLSSGNVQEAIWDAEAALVGESSINILGGMVIYIEGDLYVTSTMSANWSNVIWEGESALVTESTLVTVGTITQAILEGSASLLTDSQLLVKVSTTYTNYLYSGIYMPENYFVGNYFPKIKY